MCAYTIQRRTHHTFRNGGKVNVKIARSRLPPYFAALSVRGPPPPPPKPKPRRRPPEARRPQQQLHATRPHRCAGLQNAVASVQCDRAGRNELSRRSHATRRLGENLASDRPHAIRKTSRSVEIAPRNVVRSHAINSVPRKLPPRCPVTAPTNFAYTVKSGDTNIFFNLSLFT